VVIGAGTYALIQEQAIVRPLGSPQLKGKSQSVEVYELLGLGGDGAGQAIGREGETVTDRGGRLAFRRVLAPHHRGTVWRCANLPVGALSDFPRLSPSIRAVGSQQPRRVHVSAA